MNLVAEICNALLESPSVAAIVGSNSETARIWNGWERVNAYPCIVVEVDDDEPQNDLHGVSGMDVSQVTITCRDNTDTGANALWEAVRSSLAGYSGAFDAILDDTQRSSTPKNEGSTARWYDRVMSFTILWSNV